MTKEIIKLASYAASSDIEISKRLIALAKKINNKNSAQQRREYLKLNPQTMIGLIDSDMVEYEDKIGRVEVDSDE